jgi:hypothetical protein
MYQAAPEVLATGNYVGTSGNMTNNANMAPANDVTSLPEPLPRAQTIITDVSLTGLGGNVNGLGTLSDTASLSASRTDLLGLQQGQAGEGGGHAVPIVYAQFGRYGAQQPSQAVMSTIGQGRDAYFATTTFYDPRNDT